MAMTKETCIQAGAELFRIGLERPEGTSWQAKAMQSGWDDAEMQFGADMREDHITPNPTNHPAIHHLDTLRNMEESETNPIRKERLLAKMVKLGCKWANRGVMW